MGAEWVPPPLAGRVHRPGARAPVPCAHRLPYLPVQPLLAVDAGRIVKDFLRGKEDELKARAAANGVAGLADWFADGLAAAGQPEVANVIRQTSDVFEQSVENAINSVACYGTAAAGGAAGTAIGCVTIPIVGCLVGWVVGTAAGSLLNPACKRALEGVADAVQEAVEAWEALDDAIEPDGQPAPVRPSQSSSSCSGNAFPAADAPDCVAACESKVPETSW